MSSRLVDCRDGRSQADDRRVVSWDIGTTILIAMEEHTDAMAWWIDGCLQESNTASELFLNEGQMYLVFSLPLSVELLAS